MRTRGLTFIAYPYAVGFYRGPTAAGTGAPGEADRVYAHRHVAGWAVLHSARAWHKTDPIAAGARGSLILWSE